MRRLWLDNLRWCAVVLVVIYHAFYLCNACGVLGNIGSFAPVQPQDIFLPFVYPWIMVLLFVVAGISARYALEKKPALAFLKSRTAKLLVPSTLGLLVWHWLTGWFYANVVSGLEAGGMAQVPPAVRYLIYTLSGTGPLWFAQMLWVYSLVLVLLRKLDKGDRLHALGGKLPPVALPLLLFPMWGAARVGNVPVLTTYRFGVYGMAFLLGYAVLSHDAAQGWLKKYRLPLLAAALVTGCVYAWRYFGQDYADYALLGGFFTNFYAWLAVLAALGCFYAWGDRETGLSRYMTGASFGLYVFHYLPAAAAAWGLKSCGAPPAAVYVLSAGAGLLGGLGLWEFFRRVPLLRWVLLGLAF